MDRIYLLLVFACLVQVVLSQSPTPSPSPTLAPVPTPSPTPTPNPWNDPAFRDCLLAYANFISPPSYQYFLMMDYTGKAVDDMGNYDGCLSLPKNLSHYCVAETSVPIGKEGESVSVFLGICAPVQCNATLLHELLVVGLDKYNISGKFPIEFETEHMTMYCQPRDEKIVFSTGAIITLIVCCLIAVLVLGGTTMEYIEAQLAIKEMERLGFTEEKQGLLEEEEKRISLPVGGINISPNDVNRLTRTETGKPNKLHELLKCFAIESNIKFLMNDNRGGEPGLSALNGLRVMMMFWIILGHTFTYLTVPVGFDNSIIVTQHVIERVSFQVISAAELAVDVFFYISGFLVVYMLLKELKNRKGGIPWGLFYFHRYWRLTPVYGLIILIYTTLSPLMIYGPFAHLYRGMKTDFCDKYWWANLLYINNFVPSDSNDQCFGWGWYLADDMQFFIFTPFIVLLFKKSRKAAFALIAILIAICLSLNAFLVHKYQLHPLDPGDAQWNTIVYNKPYTRMAPYLIGIGFAFLVQYDIDLARNWMVRWAGYIIGGTATTCGTYLTYGFWRGSGWALWQNVVYATFVRVGFVLGVAWFMYACYKQHGGVLRSILSVYMWVPLARLTYTAYLTHPIIMFVINFSATTNFHYSAIYGAVRYSSHLTLAYVCGLVFHLAIEKPTANLERLFLPQKKKSSH